MSFADPRLRHLEPQPSPLPAPLVRAREGLARSTTAFLAIPDSALERDWDWQGHSGPGVRNGFYLAIQALEVATGKVRRSMVEAGAIPGPAAGPVGAATEARWDLQGLLAPLTDVELDADPGDDEWTARQTLSHILASQRAYAWFSAWWMSRRDEADFPLRAPEALSGDLPPEEEEAIGSLAEVRARLDGLVDLVSELWRDATEEDLAVPARWSAVPVTTGFRVGRWSTHMQEHTIQIEKTLAMLARAPTEVERMVRLVSQAFGRLEGATLGAAVPAPDSGEAAEAIEAALAEVAGIAQEVAEIARR